YRGFAAGVSYYVRLNPGEFPEWMEPDFTAYDVHARDVQGWSRGDARAFVRSLEDRAETDDPGDRDRLDHPSPPDRESSDPVRAAREAYVLDGSNAWALHGSRTASGFPILLRNPHLSWNAGYYEAHVRVPGVVDFYGDFRIGAAFGIVGGFNRHLGWATTNNYPDYSQVYALEADPGRENHVVVDGASVPLRREEVTVRFRTRGGGVGSETRATWWSPFGPVIHRADGRVYVLKDPRDGEFRRGEQFLKMMRATSLEEWLGVMRMRAHPSSNFTYADAAGNIAHYYNARVPALPHPPTGDTAAVVRSSDDVWTELVPFEELPLLVNPPGGYVQQANDTPDYTNLDAPLDRDTVDVNLPPRRLRLRSQLSLDLVHGTGTFDLDEVVRRKHSSRMLLAERTVDELVAVLEGAEGGRASPGEAAGDAAWTPAERTALDALEAWDRTASVDSRGGVLFEAWWERYRDRVAPEARFRVPWSPDAPTSTPRGVGRTDHAVGAFRDAVAALERKGLAPDVAWGDVHRVRRGEVDEPVAGCPGDMGCFRTLSFAEAEDGRKVANRGDGWVLAVEFGPVPRAYSVLAYGESAREDSPHYDDQAAMFAGGRMKTVAWTDDAIDAEAVRRYRPGAEAPPAGRH
ncbi:MAG: penicillin acylase family protein, partial [Gemmatimonadota bacterium]